MYVTVLSWKISHFFLEILSNISGLLFFFKVIFNSTRCLFSGIYKPVEYWQLEDQRPPSKRHHGSSVFTLKEMDEATCSSSEENLIGKGGFGRVYRGVLRSGEVD
jgi:hypothetical protein